MDDEFADAVRKVFQEEWQAAQRWARVKAFVWGGLIASAAWVAAWVGIGLG